MLLHSVDDEAGEHLGVPAVFDTQEKLLATVEQPSSDASKITMWDATRLVVTQELSLDKPPPIKLAVSGDGQSLLYINRDGSYVVLDVATRASVKSANLPPKASAAALNADGKTLVVAYDKTISIWNLASGANVRQCDTADPVGNLIWTDDGMIAYATDNGAVAILSGDSCKSENIFSFSIEQDRAADLYLRSKQGLILANLADHLQIWREKDSRKIFDSNLWASPDADAHRAYLDILPGDRIVVSGGSGSNLHIYDLATKDQILSFATDSSEYSMLEALQATSSGDQLITLWGERGDYRLGTWRLFPTIAAASALAKEVVPECLSQSSRKNLGLDPDPPRWCIEMNKRPYDTLQWREWLSNRNAGRASAFPGSN
jgi:WD40 repeat protein